MFQYFPIPEFWKTLLASLVGVLTLVGIMTRPFRWNEAAIAMTGAGYPASRGPDQLLRRLFYLDQGLEHISVFFRHDGSLSTGRGGRLV